MFLFISMVGQKKRNKLHILQGLVVNLSIHSIHNYPDSNHNPLVLLNGLSFLEAQIVFQWDKCSETLAQRRGGNLIKKARSFSH